MLSFPSSLVDLGIRRFPNLKKLSFKDFEKPRLEKLHIGFCPKLMSISELRLPPSLSELFIFDCPNLASFPEQGLPPSLSDLEISRCPNLASFPAQGLPPSLLYLSFDECPTLKRRCEKGKGQYWGFIAHIPEVEIDCRFVFDPSSYCPDFALYLHCCTYEKWSYASLGSGGIHTKVADVGANIMDKVIDDKDGENC
ncbi:hypothetical protein RHMOL_Rhmol01G0049400 [Rhododendron molle]|uniref:Uncharacterized protein n=1 Tax=Rhododendron molle TaxID=49168 RepID=A0ACC0PZM3_RHOML|nr:hypothetical protein RHMOL_Rhmol01G0049400 [Rhododendron molle]